jgi:hypothetical protein
MGKIGKIEEELLNSSSTSQSFRPIQEEEDVHPAVYFFRMFYLFLEQVLIMCQKHVSQKQRKGRQFWKDTVMIQIFLLLFVCYVLFTSSIQLPDSSVYEKLELPPLSTAKPYGIFNLDSVGNEAASFTSKRLYYTPNNHAGVQTLIDALVAKYPSVQPVGAASYDEILQMYQQNLFDTWAALVFNLNPEQVSTQKLIPNENTTATVQYGIFVNPNNWGDGYTTGNFTTDVYNKLSCDADLFWSSGYMTLQNFIGTYLASQYKDVSTDFEVISMLC